MSDLLSRRRQLMGMQTMEKNRLQIMPKEIISSINPVLTVLIILGDTTHVIIQVSKFYAAKISIDYHI
jgi:hypothetical protein